MSFVTEVSQAIIEAYTLMISYLPSYAQGFINLFLIVALIFIYAVFVWKLYRFISTKNILGLNLNQYNKAPFPFLTKLFEGGFFFIEYIIISPFIIFFWFAIFALFLIFFTQNLSVNSILILSAVVVASIRMTSYIPHYGEKLAGDLAKLLPFNLLAYSLINPGFFDFERILNQFSQLPEFFGLVFGYLLFIITIEIILRFFDFVFSLFGLEEEETEDEKEKE